MNALDWIFIVVLALLGIRCMVRGFLTEILSVAAVLVGLAAALFLYKGAAGLLVSWGLFGAAATPAAGQTAVLPGILGFAAVFLIAYLVVKLIERALKEGIEAAELGGLDRALGLALGLVEGLLVVSIVLVVMSLMAPAFKSTPGYAKLLEGSFFARLILPIVGPEVAKVTQGMKIEAPSLNLKAPTIKKP